MYVHFVRRTEHARHMLLELHISATVTQLKKQMKLRKPMEPRERMAQLRKARNLMKLRLIREVKQSQSGVASVIPVIRG